MHACVCVCVTCSCVRFMHLLVQVCYFVCPVFVTSGSLYERLCELECVELVCEWDLAPYKYCNYYYYCYYYYYYYYYYYCLTHHSWYPQLHPLPVWTQLSLSTARPGSSVWEGLAATYRDRRFLRFLPLRGHSWNLSKSFEKILGVSFMCWRGFFWPFWLFLWASKMAGNGVFL